MFLKPPTLTSVGQKVDRRHVLIAFSGGMDSTLLAFQALEMGCNLTLLYSEEYVHNFYPKTKMQNTSVKALLHWFRSKYPQQRINLITVKTAPTVVVNNHDYTERTTNLESFHSGDGFFQLPAWLHLLSTVVSEQHHEVQIGIHGEDMILAHYHEIMLNWETTMQLKKLANTPLTFPLMKHRKVDVILNLPAELVALTWFCERPVVLDNDEIRCCGCCIPCKTFIGALAAETEHLVKLMRFYRDKMWYDPKKFPLVIPKQQHRQAKS